MSWETVKLGDLCKMNSGGTPSRSNLSFYNGQIPWAKISDIENAEGGIIKFTEEHITSEGLSSINNRIFEKGTLLLAMYGSVGKVAFAGMAMSTNQAILGIKINDESRIVYSYLKYWFQTIKEQLLNRAVGGTLQNISLGIVKELQIPLPPLPIQKRIAEILDAADALKRKDQELLKKYDELAQAIFIDMFGDPVKNEKGWEVKKLEEITSFIDYRGKTPERSEIQEVPLITAKNVKFGYYDFSEKDFVTLKKYNEIMTRGFPKVGDVLFTTEGATLGNVCRIPKLEKFAIGQRLICMSGDEVTSEYLHYILCSKFFQVQVYKYATGSAVKGIRSAVLKKLIIPVPKHNLQLKFSCMIKLIEIQLHSATINSNNSNNLFQTLIQKAFNGELVTE